MSSSTLALSALKQVQIDLAEGGEIMADTAVLVDGAVSALEAVQVEPNTTKEDANNYCLILTALGMEEEGDPVAEVKRLVSHYGMDDEAVQVEPVAPGMKQLIAQLNDDQKWTVSEQQQFAEFLKRFPNESSQGIISLGDAWKYGKACASPQEPAVNAELLEALQEIEKLSIGWDEDGSIGQNPPHYSWETVARLALDYSRAAITKATGCAA